MINSSLNTMHIADPESYSAAAYSTRMQQVYIAEHNTC